MFDEVDVHLSLDGIVVICHDALLKRLYGVDAEVTSLPWKNGLDQLRTLREPHSPMLTFRQLLEKLASAESAHGTGNGVDGAGQRTLWKDAWILMDIKVNMHRFIQGQLDLHPMWVGYVRLIFRSIIHWKSFLQ